MGDRKLGSNIVATFTIDGNVYDLYGCWDTETPEGENDFYDLVDSDGETVNLGDPWYASEGMPTETTIKKYVQLINRRGDHND